MTLRIYRTRESERRTRLPEPNKERGHPDPTEEPNLHPHAAPPKTWAAAHAAATHRPRDPVPPLSERCESRGVACPAQPSSTNGGKLNCRQVTIDSSLSYAQHRICIRDLLQQLPNIDKRIGVIYQKHRQLHDYRTKVHPGTEMSQIRFLSRQRNRAPDELEPRTQEQSLRPASPSFTSCHGT